MEPHAHLSAEEKKALFTSVTITHRQLEAVHDRIRRAIRQPAGFSFVLVHGPTGVGKTRMMESLAEQARDLLLPQSALASSFPLTPYRLSPPPMPVLMIEAKFPDKNAFNRGQFYRTILKLLGEQTYPQQMQVDIHAESAAPKRRRLSHTASESNDDPELREATDAAMHLHGVRVLFVDEAHHMLYGKEGTGGSALQEQLEWLKSLGSQTGVLFVLVGTYDLFNFGKLSGQTARRCLPVHFPRYQLEREENCVEFQSTLLELLRRVPLECPAERWVADHWLYSTSAASAVLASCAYWLLRAVSTALDDGKNRLSLDCVQDHALPVDIYRQMALDAYEGEQRLNHTEVNREHVWRLLQGGELIAPVPPLPPREVPDVVEPSSSVKSAQPGEQLGNGAVPPAPLDEAPLPTPPVKKTRTRKKAVTVPAEPTDPGPVIQVETGEPPAIIPAKRGRKKKTGGDEALAAKEQEAKSPSESPGQSSPVSTEADVVSAPTKPKRNRRVGEPKAKRYPVGDPEAEQGA